MQLGKYLRYFIRIVLFILLLVLVLDNLQTVQLSIFGTYIIRLPLIVLVLSFMVIGILIGLIFNLSGRIELKNKLNTLQKTLDKIN